LDIVPAETKVLSKSEEQVLQIVGGDVGQFARLSLPAADTLAPAIGSSVEKQLKISGKTPSYVNKNSSALPLAEKKIIYSRLGTAEAVFQFIEDTYLVMPRVDGVLGAGYALKTELSSKQVAQFFSYKKLLTEKISQLTAKQKTKMITEAESQMLMELSGHYNAIRLIPVPGSAVK
jgi:hypothetical protein